MSLLRLKEDEYFIKEDGNNQRTLYIKNFKRQVFLNETAFLVFELCKKEDDIKSIITYFEEKFPNVPYNKIVEDIRSIINVFEIYKLVDTNNIYPDKERKISFAGDLDYIILSEFIINNFDNKHSYMKTSFENKYDPLTLRSKTMTNKEYYIIHMDKTELDFTMLISPPLSHQESSVVRINGFITTIEEYEHKKSLFLNVLDHYIQNNDLEYGKFRVSILQDSIDKKETKNIIKFIEDIGFGLEVILEKELKGLDVYQYSLIRSK